MSGFWFSKKSVHKCGQHTYYVIASDMLCLFTLKQIKSQFKFNSCICGHIHHSKVSHKHWQWVHQTEASMWNQELMLLHCFFNRTTVSFLPSTEQEKWCKTRWNVALLSLLSLCLPVSPHDLVIMVGSSPLGAGWQTPHFNLPCIVFIFCHIYLTSLQESWDRWIFLLIFFFFSQPTLVSLQWFWSSSESNPLAN